MSWSLGKKPSVVGGATGAVAGLVAITPAAGFVGPVPSILIGVGSGIFCYLAVGLVERIRIDDSLAVWGVHGVGGIWGALATGLFVGVGFATLAEDVSRFEQVSYQLIGISVTLLWSFGLTSGILIAIRYSVGLRVKDEEEMTGLDVAVHGEPAYGIGDFNPFGSGADVKAAPSGADGDGD
jgi:Amt family ammonium transporter